MILVQKVLFFSSFLALFLVRHLNGFCQTGPSFFEIASRRVKNLSKTSQKPLQKVAQKEAQKWSKNGPKTGQKVIQNNFKSHGLLDPSKKCSFS